MSTEMIHGTSIDVEAVRHAIGGVPRVAYEAAHVYPLSAPHFTPSPGLERARPDGGTCRLYVHIPFCRYACTFCFYAKRIGSSRAQMQRYVDAVRRELDGFRHDGVLHQLYIGGGTPTALPADLLDAVLAAVNDGLPLDTAACHTVEGSPESVTAAHAEVLRQRGIGRISVGVQTLDESLLQSINRQHSAQQALDACRLLVDSGLTLNVDLIYGFPGQTEDSLRRDVETFAELGADSLTLYNLRLNERTPVAQVADDLQRVDLSTLMRWRRFIEITLDNAGYAQSRWHTFARKDREHAGHDRAPGMNAFGIGREVGVGVSAFSHIGDTIYRNHQSFDAYLERIEVQVSPVEDVFPLTPADRRTLFVARTLGDGRRLDPQQYADSFGSRVEDDFPSALRRVRAARLVEDDAHGCLALTETGRLVYDLVTLAFYPDQSRTWLDAQQTTVRKGKRSAAGGEQRVPSP